MIVAAGESLIDLMAGPHGEVHARPGGGPFHAARTIARLGHQTRFPRQILHRPPGRLPTDRVTQAGAELILPGPAEKAHDACRRRRHRLLIPDRTAREIPNGTDNS